MPTNAIVKAICEKKGNKPAKHHINELPKTPSAFPLDYWYCNLASVKIKICKFLDVYE